MNRFYKEEEQEQVHNRFNNGGVLWFIERTDTNQFFYEPLRIERSHDEFVPDSGVDWMDNISLFGLSGAFLTKEDAEKYNNFTQGGCRYCGNGSKKIPTKITEHIFGSK